MRHSTVAAALSVSLGVTIPPAIAPGAHADRLDLDDVAHDAVWVIHLDNEAWYESSFGELVLGDSPMFSDFRDDIAEIRAEFAFDLTKDLRDVTFYSTDWESGVGIASTTSDVESILDRLIEQDRAERIQLDGMALYRMKGKRDAPMHAMVRQGDTARERIVIMGENVVHIGRAAQVLEAEIESLRGNSERVLAFRPRRGSILFVGGRNTGDMKALQNVQQASVIAEKAALLAADFGETDATAYLSAVATTHSEQDARDIADILQGLAALGRVLIGEEEDLEHLKNVLTELRFSSSGSSVHVDITMPPEDVIDLFYVSVDPDKGFDVGVVTGRLEKNQGEANPGNNDEAGGEDGAIQQAEKKGAKEESHGRRE